MRDLPRPLTPDQLFMAGVCDRLDAQNTLLGEIRDRLGQASDETPPVEFSGPRPVELREPEPAAANVAEPEPPVPAEPETKAAPRKRPAKSARGAR